MFKFRKNGNLESSYSIRLSGSLEISKLVLLVASLCDGVSNIKNIAKHKIIDSLIDIIEKFGICISKNGNSIVVNGRDIEFWQQPKNFINIIPEYDIINYVVSIISVKNFKTFITSNTDFINNNIIDFLYLDNNNFVFRDREKHFPVMINGEYKLQKNSIKIKNTIEKNALLFNFFSNQTKRLILSENGVKSDYLERILNFYKLDIRENQFESRNFLTGERIKCKEICLTNTNKVDITGKDFVVPADIKEAIYSVFIALILDLEEMTIENISINEFNGEIVNVLIENGVDIELKNQKILNGIKTANMVIKKSKLKPLSISKDRFLKILNFYPLVIMLNIIRKNTILIYGIREVEDIENKNYEFMIKFFKKIDAIITEDKKAIELDFTNAILNNIKEIKISKEDCLDEKTMLAFYLSNIVLNKDLMINDFSVLNIFPNVNKIFQILGIECDEQIM